MRTRNTKEDTATTARAASESGFDERVLPTADGHHITARFFFPPGKFRAGALIAPAMGVSQPFYEALAAWLAAVGVVTATFDYRGIGLSRSGHVRDVKADIFDWAERDCAAVLEALTSLAPDGPCYWIGHSLGGQIVPFVPHADRATKVVTIAAGSGYWRVTAPRLRGRALILWHLVVPVSVGLAGYFPGKRLGIVGDLPRGVVRQWRRWCLHPEYAAGAENAHALYASVHTPMVSFSFTDDEFMSAEGIEALHAAYVNAPRTMHRIAPAEVGAARIGHFGFFRASAGFSLWERHLLPALGLPA